MLSEHAVSALQQIESQTTDRRGRVIDEEVALAVVHTTLRDLRLAQAFKTGVMETLDADERQALLKQELGPRRTIIGVVGRLDTDPNVRAVFKVDSEARQEFQVQLFTPLDWQRAINRAEIHLGNARLLEDPVESAKDLFLTIVRVRKSPGSSSFVAKPPRNVPPPILLMDDTHETGSLRVVQGNPFSVVLSTNHHSREATLIRPALTRVERALRQTLELPRRPSRR